MAPTTKTIQLTFGYTSPQGGDPHKTVVFGRRVTGADLMGIGDRPESQKQLQFELMLIQTAITTFGTLSCPVPLTTLLTLNRVDRDDLSRAYAEYLKESAGGRASKKLSDSSLQLPFGLVAGGQTYDVVEFGHLLTGFEELEADDLDSWRQACFLLGRQITKLSQSGGAAVLKGPVAPEAFEGADGSDVFAMQAFIPDWLDSFRRQARREVQADGGAGDRVSDAAPGQAGGGDTRLE